MKHKGKASIFDSQFSLEEVTEKGIPLYKLNNCINWDIFKEKLDEWFEQPSTPKAGRPPYVGPTTTPDAAVALRWGGVVCEWGDFILFLDTYCIIVVYNHTRPDQS